MTINPVGDRVLIKPDPVEDTTVGGIIIPDTAKEKPSTGEVIAVGPGTKDVVMEVHVGDVVMFPHDRKKQDNVEIDGEKYLILRMDEISAVVKY